MFGVQIVWPVGLVFACSFAALAAAVAFRRRIVARFEPQLAAAKPIVALLCVPAAFIVSEYPYNPRLFEMEPYFVLLGLAVLGVLFAIVFFLGQRSKASMLAFLAVCFFAGVANFFVSSFKGQPILPSDVMAIQTAAAVSGGYVYVVGNRVVASCALLLLMAALIVLLPKEERTRKRIALNAGIGAALLAVFCAWFAFSDIENDLRCDVDVWSSLNSYQEHGSALCFLQRAQKLAPRPPQDYSAEEAQRLREERMELALAATAEDEAQATAPEVRPTIIAVMNETFSDLSRYPGVSESYSGPAFFNAIDDALMKGDVYVSALGGGTCNSEFEFLTGSSAGLLGPGTYPYMLYDFDGVDNLASYLSSLGYATSAIHPADAANWRRDRVYEQFGFDEFYDIAAFQEAPLFRSMPTDASTYDLILELLEQNEEPQFIFDVTIASHGGYDTGEIPEEEMLHAAIGGQEYADFDEYISCIERSDAELRAFIEKLSALERPVVLCFFGDHQPGFADWLAELTMDADVDTMDIESVQERYVTPYMIWTNSDALKHAANYAQQQDMSLNYLGAATLRAAGLPLDEYFSFVASVQEDLPAINLNGYLDVAGVWHWHDGEEESGALQAYHDLAIVQYSNLFG